MKTAQTRLLPQYIGMNTPSLIRPLCAPIMPDDSFGADVAGRYSERVYSLWKRLSLVYAEENTQAAAPEKPPVIVNSFTSKVLVQLFAGDHFSRLIRNDQPNSVFSTKYSEVALAEKKRAAAEIVKYVSRRAEFTSALEEFGRTLSGTASEKGAFVALAALSHISGGKLTEGGRKALARISSAIKEADGAAAATAEELSRETDGGRAAELSAKLVELTRRYAEIAEKNRELSAAVQCAAETLGGGAELQETARRALVRYDERYGVRGAAAERVRALTDRPNGHYGIGVQDGINGHTAENALNNGGRGEVGGRRVQGSIIPMSASQALLAERQARAGLSGTEAQTAELAAQILLARGVPGMSALSAGNSAQGMAVLSVQSAGVPAGLTAGGIPAAFGGRDAQIIYAQDADFSMQAAAADIAVSAARRAAAFGGRSESAAERLLGRASRYISDKLAFEQRAAMRGMDTNGASDSAAQYLAIVSAGTKNFYRNLSEYAERPKTPQLTASGIMRGMSRSAAGMVYAENGADGVNGANGMNAQNGEQGRDGTNGANGANGENGRDGANSANAAPARGTVLPVEAARGALAQGAGMVYAENGADGRDGANGANGAQGRDGTNGANVAAPSGTVLPVEAARGALTQGAGMVYAENGADGANGANGMNAQNGAQGRVGLNGANGENGRDGRNGANAATSRGTVLPVEAARGALSQGAGMVYAENGADGVNGANGINAQNGAQGRDGTNGANGANGAQGRDGANGENAAPARGTVLPVEAAHGALAQGAGMVYAENGADGANGANGMNAQNGEQGRDGTNGANGANGAQGRDGANGANVATPSGTVLPVEAARGALSQGAGMVYAENGADGANAAPARGTVLPIEAARGALSQGAGIVYVEDGADGRDGTNGMNAQNGANGRDGRNGANAAPARGTVLPIEAARGALTHGAGMVYAENGADGANGANGMNGMNAQSGADGRDGANGANAAPARGTVLPVEAARGALTHGAGMVYAENGADGANGTNGMNAQNGAQGRDGLNGVNGTQGRDGANGANAAPARGTVLPVEAARGALTHGAGMVYAENGADGANGTNGMNAQSGADGRDGANAAPARGTVLPVEAARGALSQGAGMVYVEDGADGRDGTNGMNAQNGANGRDGANGANAAPARGTVLPIEAARGALSQGAGMVYVEDGADGVNGANGINGAQGRDGRNGANGAIHRERGRIVPLGGSLKITAGVDTPAKKPAATQENMISHAVMEKLDPKTASALTGLVREAKGSAESGAVYTARISPAELNHSAPQLLSAQLDGGISRTSAGISGGISTDVMRIMLMDLKNTALSRRNITVKTAEISHHMKKVIKAAGDDPAKKYTDAHYLAMRSAVSFKTAENADIVMLTPPVEMDRFSAESGYSRQMPPIDFRQREESPAPAPAAKPKPVNKTTEQTVRTQIPKGLDDLSYTEISRLADKVYAQIEARLNRERIRRGF